MTPKEKADELIELFLEVTADGSFPSHKAKECALIAVDEILDMVKHTPIEDIENDYWQEVKHEIEKL